MTEKKFISEDRTTQTRGMPPKHRSLPESATAHLGEEEVNCLLDDVERELKVVYAVHEQFQRRLSEARLSPLERTNLLLDFLHTIRPFTCALTNRGLDIFTHCIEEEKRYWDERIADVRQAARNKGS